MVDPTAAIPPASREAVLETFGLLGYGQLLAFSRLAEDAPHAPALADRLVLSRMAAGELAQLEDLQQYVNYRGGDLAAAMGHFHGVLGDLDARTAPQDWPERLMRMYIGYGIVADFQREVSAGLDERSRTVAQGALATNGFDDYVVSVLRPMIDADSRHAARLALWGRRVVGEALSLAQHALVHHRLLADLLHAARPGEDTAALLARLERGHSLRMERLGLAA